jgi:hypothetical protein
MEAEKETIDESAGNGKKGRAGWGARQKGEKPRWFCEKSRSLAALGMTRGTFLRRVKTRSAKTLLNFTILSCAARAEQRNNRFPGFRLALEAGLALKF